MVFSAQVHSVTTIMCQARKRNRQRRVGHQRNGASNMPEERRRDLLRETAFRISYEFSDRYEESKKVFSTGSNRLEQAGLLE
jgi:hypothetical protein